MIIDSSQKDGVSDITVEENQKNCASGINVDSNQTNSGLGIGSDLNRKKFREVRCSQLGKGKVAEHITERLFTVAEVMNNEHEDETCCETDEINSLASGIVCEQECEPLSTEHDVDLPNLTLKSPRKIIKQTTIYFYFLFFRENNA